MSIFRIPEDVSEVFETYYQNNRNVYRTKAALLRVMISNIDLLAQINSNNVDPEKETLKKQISKLQEKNIQLENEISLCNDNNNTKKVLLELSETIGTIQKMVSAIYLSDNTSTNSSNLKSLWIK